VILIAGSALHCLDAIFQIGGQENTLKMSSQGLRAQSSNTRAHGCGSDSYSAELEVSWKNSVTRTLYFDSFSKKALVS